MTFGELGNFAVRSTREALAAGKPREAMEWLDGVDEAERPKDLAADVFYHSAKAMLAIQKWGKAEEFLSRSYAYFPSALVQQRLALVRRRQGIFGDDEWSLLHSQIEPAQRLRPDSLRPEIVAVHSCGAYYSRGRRSSAPWSKFLRLTKDPSGLEDERSAIVAISVGYMSRFIVEKTDLLNSADVVTSIPANAGRYVDRGWSFPDELARGLEQALALPFAFDAVRMNADVELRGLSWRERRDAIRGGMRPGALGVAEGHTVLLVDDVITSGATMKEGARAVLSAGASSVVAISMSHTEG